jgi:alcohol oxidase
MDPLWREKESAIQGRRVFHHIPNAPFNYPNTESLAQWKSNGKSLIAQKSAQFIAAGDVLMSIAVAAMPKLSWQPDGDELRTMGSAFQIPWKEFFQNRPDKAVAIFAICAGCVHITSLLVTCKCSR